VIPVPWGEPGLEPGARENMRAIVRQRMRTSLESRALPPRVEGWVRLRVLLAGICRTDVQAADGLFPIAESRILGHEMAGEVAEADAGSELRPGDRVTVAPLLPCGACAGCATASCCAEPRMLGVDVDGAFAEEVVVPSGSVLRVPHTLSLRRAAYIEPVAAALAVVRAPIRVEQRGVVLGTGRIADLTARVLRHLGFRLGQAKAGGQASFFDYVVETAGTDASLDEALDHVAPGGCIVLKSRPPRAVALDVARAVRNDVTICAVSYGPWHDAIRLAGELPVDDLLGDVYPLERFDAAMALTRERPLGPKIFLSPDARS
jgi:threonine dehydrogenase-like Zn-dependent dehydrogenase